MHHFSIGYDVGRMILNSLPHFLGGCQWPILVEQCTNAQISFGCAFSCHYVGFDLVIGRPGTTEGSGTCVLGLNTLVRPNADWVPSHMGRSSASVIQNHT